MAALGPGPGLEAGDAGEFVCGSLFANAGSGWFGRWFAEPDSVREGSEMIVPGCIKQEMEEKVR